MAKPNPTEDIQSKETFFSYQRSAIPFGKYEAGSDDSFPCNESMVGREGARAKLIDFLTNGGTRRAILITGRRGMGKTSFVQYCLQEYEESYVERYWRSNSGKNISSLFWFLVISALCASIFVLANKMLQILLSDAAIQQHILWLPATILTLFMLFPLTLASKIFTKLFEERLPASHICGVLLIPVIIAILAMLIPGTGSPVVALSRLLVSISVVYYAGELLDLLVLPSRRLLIETIQQPSTICNILKHLKKLKKGVVVVFFLLALSVATFFLTFYFQPVVAYSENFLSKNDSIPGTSTFISNIIVFVAIFSCAAITRSFRLSCKPEKLDELQIGQSIKKAKRWYFFVSFTLLVGLFIILIVGLFEWLNYDHRPILKLLWKSGWCIVLLIMFIIQIISWKFIQREKKINDYDYTRRYLYPSSLLFLKAIFFIFLSMHAVHPVLSLINKLGTHSAREWTLKKDTKGIVDYPNLSSTSLILTEKRPYCNVNGGAISTENMQCSLSTRYRSLFPGTQGEYLYIALVVIIVVLLFWVEYEWIIRPQQFDRRDRSMYTGSRPEYYDDSRHGTPTPESVPENTDEKKRKENARNVIHKYVKKSAEARKRHRDFESLTFLRNFYHFHLSTIINTINLGFEELDHRSVIHGMLLSLRAEYHEKFISLRSPRVISRFGFGIFLAMILVTSIAEQLFDAQLTANPSNHDKSNYNNYERTKYTIRSYGEKTKLEEQLVISEAKEKTVIKYCVAENKNVTLPPVPKVLCELGGFYAGKLLPFLYFELLSVSLPKDELPSKDILKYNFDIHTPYYDSKGEERWCLCVFHLILFFFVFYLFRKLNRHFAFVPYTLILEKIDDLLDALTATTTTKKSRDLPRIARWVPSIFGDYQENERSTAKGNLDPRIVELTFMRLLKEISFSRSLYFRPFHSGDNTAAVEITFVFDELDKLATDINSQQAKGDPDSNDSELHRLNLMKGLLSNMKRIITSSDARYIFLGGRLLHDDWIADGARRQPLLTSIFSDEIYLPSLLCDASMDWFDRPNTSVVLSSESPGYYSLDARVEELFVSQYYLARIRFELWVLRAWSPPIGLREVDLRPRGFMQASYRKLKSSMMADYTKQIPSLSPLGTIPIQFTDTGHDLNQSDCLDREHDQLKAFVHFLAYRSTGNPKRLNELLASFMMSTDRAVPDKNARAEGFDCQDVLNFPDPKVIRIQLIGRVYQQLQKCFEEKIRGRDDKTITVLIYLSDFLFKFHGRAFSWESLELVDDLIHMHRGHDLRVLLHALVDNYSDRFLHKITNGMYTYRFRSYFANEIEYLSRNSDEEMAAFNFTLDEAQTLRDNLRKLLSPGNERDKTDIMSMLGELHEFYQEFDLAREYYRACIRARKYMVEDNIGNTVKNDGEEMPVLGAIFTNTPAGRKALLTLLHWGPITLRLLLKIAMTYERARNSNEALIRYKRCMQFAEAMIQAFASAELEGKRDFAWHYQPRDINPNNTSAHVLEYLGILFEPLFAYAWLLEKNAYTAGNSIQVLEGGIESFKRALGKVNEQPIFGLVYAQWAKKAGNLCFYKGLAKTDNKSYLRKSEQHYLSSAKELSRYFRESAKTEYIAHDSKSFIEALNTNRYSAEHNLSVAECIGDLSEIILAGICPCNLFSSRKLPTNSNFQSIALELIKSLDQCFFDSKQSLAKDDTHFLDCLSTTRKGGDSPQNGFFNNLNFAQKFEQALNLSMTSSFYMLRAGYPESAAREAIHTAEIVAQYLNWYWINCVTQNKAKYCKDNGFSVILKMLDMVVWYSDYLLWALSTVRFGKNRSSERSQSQKQDKPYQIDDIIPVSALTSLCAIGMSVSLFEDRFFDQQTGYEPFSTHLEQLGKIIHKWTGQRGEPSACDVEWSGWYRYFQRQTINLLRRHRYPVLNQLYALKALVDASLIRGFFTDNKEVIKNCKAWLHELYEVNEKYNYPLHFTPMQSGLSLYLYGYVKDNRPNLGLENIEIFDLDSETRRLLDLSLDMCHTGRGYFSIIEKMYYLYDDFNDNQIHKNHALQMASSTLVKKALAELGIRAWKK